jgi:hypothetical protein
VRVHRAAAVLPVLLALLAACGGGEGTVAYVAVAGDNHVRLVDLGSGETLRRLYTGAAPWRLALSPDDGRLWVQHWYAGDTVVVDPAADHAVAGSLPFRGPGAFLPEGVWLTADWPGRTLAVVDPATLAVREEHDSEIKEVYDLAPFAGGRRLVLVQHDPMARGAAPRYAYVLSYELPAAPPAAQGAAAEEPALPVSHPVGRDPVAVVPVPGQPFFLTADSGTNGIHLVNQLGDRRALAVCPAPRAIAVSADGRRTAVLCWRGRGAALSRVVLFDSDYGARPWPRLERRAEAAFEAALVAAAFDPADGRLWVVDRAGGRLLGIDGDLSVRREVPVGDLPADLVLTRFDRRQRRRAAEVPEHRLRLERVLARVAAAGGGFEALSWSETLSWQEPAVDGAGRPLEDALPVERSRKVAVELRADGALRTESPDGGVRLAAGADAVRIDAAGRFWTTPRQDLLGVVLALPAMDGAEALRRLAGDVPGGPELANGIAVDRLAEVVDAGGRFLVVGAGPAGERVSQLWIDLDAALPVQLVERFPVFGAGGAPAVAETELAEWAPVGGGAGGEPPVLPRRLRRVVEGTWVQNARVDGAEEVRSIAVERFDPARLGGVEPDVAQLFAAATAVGAAAAGGAAAVPVDLPETPLGGPSAAHPPYRSNPPTSGAHLSWAPDAGVHAVPVPLPLQVHHLLDGGIALQYDCPRGCPELVAALAAVAARHPGVLVAPYPWLGDRRLALTAWGRLQLLDAFEATVVEAFVTTWGGRDHHRDAPPSAAATEDSRSSGTAPDSR